MIKNRYRKQPSRACETAIMQAAARQIGVEHCYWHARRIRRTIRLGVAAGVTVMVLVWLYLANMPRRADYDQLCASWEWSMFEAESRSLAAGLDDLQQKGN